MGYDEQNTSVAIGTQTGEIMESITQLQPPDNNWRGNYRYSVYKHRLFAPDGSIYTRPFIVIRNMYGAIVRFTNLHNYANIFAGKIFVPMNADATKKLFYICKMFNYALIERDDEYGIDHIFQISREMLEQFFNDYATTESRTGGFRSEPSVEFCVSAVTEFFRNLCRKFGRQMLLNEADLVTERNVYTKRGGIVVKTVPAFQVRGIRSSKRTFRELPTKAFKILINLAFRYAPDIAFAMCLQAFAGLRAGEACNIRQEQSPIGGSLKVTRVGNDVRKVEIDLTRELPMRSDAVFCGNIKKERIQCVYHPFLDAFDMAYQHHKKWLSSQKYEHGYCPMFVNNRGKAMTYNDYRNRFICLVDERFRPALLQSGDADCRLYGQMLYENRLGLHSLRHWFSVQLVLHGEDIAQIQYWRGDKNPESALTYLQNKGDLVKELEKANETLIEILMGNGKREIGDLF